MVKAHGEAMDDYRKASAERHALLRRMMPDWRLIKETLGRVNTSVESVLARSMVIDRHMEEYDAIVRGEDRAVAVLSSSSIVYFFVSAFVLAVAIAGAAINFTLIARPMAEMVGGTSFIGDFHTADIAALVIIMVEISMGLFLMESLRITRLFPVISALSDKMRVRMIIITFAILLMMASIEAGLAYMREVLLQDELATSSLLRGDGSAAAATRTCGLPPRPRWAWVSFCRLRCVCCDSAGDLRAFAAHGHGNHRDRGHARAVVAAAGSGQRIASPWALCLQRIYDLLLFVPLWIETRMAAAAAAEAAEDAAEAAAFGHQTEHHMPVEAEALQEAQS